MKLTMQGLGAAVLKWLSVRTQVIFTQTNVVSCSFQLSFDQIVACMPKIYPHPLSHTMPYDATPPASISTSRRNPLRLGNPIDCPAVDSRVCHSFHESLDVPFTTPTTSSSVAYATSVAASF